ncbi:hypothetical protein NKJ88_30520 [Mesorhizobium sp. M0016]|uniref:hypothetical protein n=1 Tax=Mesorhizobium sp. M0016 TaxID=2956843 RepID=UPI00333C1DF2
MKNHQGRRGATVIRITLSYIYNLAAALEPIGTIAPLETNKTDLYFPALIAHNAISELITSTMYAPHLRASYQYAQSLMVELAKVIKIPIEGTVPQYEMFTLKQAYDQYKTVLLADLAILHAYFVSQKGGYDTWTLLMFGESLFPSDLATKVPEAVFDAREAGKCLAYENATAAGFHIFRVLEAVLRRYYTHVTGGRPQPKVRNIAVYVNAMRQSGKGDEKVLFLVKEISDRFRNPLIHPDTALTVDAGIATHGLVRTAVTEMLQPLVIPELTTSTAVISLEAGQ